MNESTDHVGSGRGFLGISGVHFAEPLQ